VSATKKFPNVHVKLVGEDGNAYAIMGRAQRAARRAGVPEAEIAKYLEEATSGSYDHLLVTTMDWFNTDDEPEDEPEDDE
jgi:hypothetical protein